MKKNYYFILQLKKAFKSYPVILAITFITLLGVAFAGISIVKENFGDENKQLVNIGVVGDIDNSYLKFGLSTIQNLDNSRFYIKLREMKEDEAKSALDSGDIHGYVYIPDNFVNGIQRGENIPATFITQNNPDNFGTILTTEATKIISDILTETQIGVYAFQRIVRDTRPDISPHGLTNELNMKYIEHVLERAYLLEVHDLGIADSISIPGYYICGIIMFFLLLWGISCNKLLTAKNISLERSLNTFGLKPFRQILCEYIPFLIITVITFLILAVIAGIALDGNNFGIRELENADVVSCIMFIARALPVLIMITAMHMLLYELVSGTVSAILLQFLVSVGLGYICGCFYPNTFFPENIQSFAAVLPAGTGFSYLRKLMTETLSPNDLIPIAAYITLFVTATTLIRKYRIAGETQ